MQIFFQFIKKDLDMFFSGDIPEELDRKGDMVLLEDGRKGIVYADDQDKNFKGKNLHLGKNSKVLVTMCDDDFNPVNERKRIVRLCTLRHKGFVGQ